MSPVQPAKRLELIDALRGAALLGILASNMRAFNSPMVAYFDHSLMWTSIGDRIAQGVVDLFISGKFITLFAFLFGIGFAIQMDRAAERGVPSRFYLRRLSILLVFGLLHGFLLWTGDILAPYALMGFALYLFRNRRQKTIARWAVACYLWPMVPLIGGAIATAAGVPMDGPSRSTPAEVARIVQIYAAGTYPEIFQQHVKEMSFQAIGLFFFYPRVLGLFLAGLWVWRSGFLSNLGEQKPLLRRFVRWGLAVGLAGNAAMVAIGEIWHPDPYVMGPVQVAQNLAATIGVPMMSLFYACTFALAYRGAAVWRARLHPFTAVGRTALTNYLMQSVVLTAVFNSWGLGLFGTVSPAVGIAIAFLAYAAQLGASVWYVRRFAFGPVEWLWRALTYGRAPDPRRLAAV
jgi:uncharacterized protein